MQGRQGDELVVKSPVLGAPSRRGEILEVIGDAERRHYRVRWDDGHESVYFPGPDAHVVPTGRPAATARGTIVVGVDGSDCSRTALEFALAEAVRRGDGVRVVAVLPDTAYWAGAYAMSPSLVDELTADLEKVARTMVDDLVRERGGSAADVPVEVLALDGSPGHVLVDRSRDADMLVVGHRGRGGFRSVALGSVGLQCVLHASVPVTVVR